LKKSHALNPNDFAVVRMLAALSQERGDHAAAIQYYEQVLEYVHE
jgi:cytochrome c-type biogenesis protein CcmH/NrfG